MVSRSQQETEPRQPMASSSTLLSLVTGSTGRRWGVPPSTLRLPSVMLTPRQQRRKVSRAAERNTREAPRSRRCSQVVFRVVFSVSYAWLDEQIIGHIRNNTRNALSSRERPRASHSNAHNQHAETVLGTWVGSGD